MKDVWKADLLESLTGRRRAGLKEQQMDILLVLPAAEQKVLSLGKRMGSRMVEKTGKLTGKYSGQKLVVCLAGLKESK